MSIQRRCCRGRSNHRGFPSGWPVARWPAGGRRDHPSAGRRAGTAWCRWAPTAARDHASHTLDEVRDMLAYMARHRTDAKAFEVVIGGQTSGSDHAQDRATVQSYIDAGATWWLEDVSPWAFGWTWRENHRGTRLSPISAHLADGLQAARPKSGSCSRRQRDWRLWSSDSTMERTGHGARGSPTC